MAGSPVYGKGYYDGTKDAREQDLLIAGIILVVGVLAKGGHVVYKRLRKKQTAKVEQEMALLDPEEGCPAAGEDDNEDTKPTTT